GRRGVIMDRHVRAAAGELQRDGATDALRAARDERPSAPQLHERARIANGADQSERRYAIKASRSLAESPRAAPCGEPAIASGAVSTARIASLVDSARCS